jgi:peptidylprolyl isomerase
MRIVSRFLAVVVVLLTITACVSRSGSAIPPLSAPPPERSPVFGECDTNDITVGGVLGAEPTITLPTGCTAPTVLLTRDVEVGHGRRAGQGANLSVAYVMITWSDGVKVDSSWSAGENLPFDVENLGRANVINGWNEGLLGIRAGGRRLIVVPPATASGDEGGATDTLVFVIDALVVSR